MTTLLLAGLGLGCLPHLLLGALIVALFLLILWLICSHVLPPPYQPYVNWTIVIVLLILLLIILIQIYQFGLAWVC
jgi:hypothetical protein